mgnify:CR=1 FL=1|jgi:hypothetical protein
MDYYERMAEIIIKTLSEEAEELAPQLDKGYHAEPAGPVARPTMNGKGYRYYLRQQANRREV